MTEEEHDTEVAPLLLQAAKKAKELGGTVLCYSEYGKIRDDGIKDNTKTMVATDMSPAAQLVHMAMQAKGNLDALMFGLVRAHGEGTLDLSRTLFLSFVTRRGEQP